MPDKCPSDLECVVPEYMLGPCGETDTYNEDGTLAYRAPSPYLGPVHSNISYILYDDVLYEDNAESALAIMELAGVGADELNRTWYADCLWVKEFEGDPDVVSTTNEVSVANCC